MSGAGRWEAAAAARRLARGSASAAPPRPPWLREGEARESEMGALTTRLRPVRAPEERRQSAAQARRARCRGRAAGCADDDSRLGGSTRGALGACVSRAAYCAYTCTRERVRVSEWGSTSLCSRGSRSGVGGDWCAAVSVVYTRAVAVCGVRCAPPLRGAHRFVRFAARGPVRLFVRWRRRRVLLCFYRT